MTLSVCAITSGRTTPSARFRIRQHIGPLSAHDVAVVECVSPLGHAMPMPGPLSRMRRRHVAPAAFAWAAAHAVGRLPAIVTSARCDVTWIERAFVPGLEGCARLLRSPIVLDIDDAVWLEGLGGRSSSRLAARASAGIAGNAFLADWLSAHCRNVTIVPTAIDCSRFVPAESPRATQGVVLGWTGTSGNLRYLEGIAPALRAVLDAGPDITLHVVSDRRPALPGIPASRLHFEPWTPDREARALQAMDIGLMPLDDTEWTRGKCSFKMLQYMAAGLPTVVSPVGMNVEVLSHGSSGLAARTLDEWVDAMRYLAGDPAARARMGGTGREVVLAHYDVPIVSARLAGVLREAAR